MKLTTKQLTLCAVLTALALALSYLENLFPLSLAIPIPGIKLGLANIVTVFALYALGPAQAFLILLARCFLGAVFAGNMNALIFSLLGGVTAMVVMIVLSAVPFRLWGLRGRCGSSQLRAGGGGGADAGQYGAPLLSACFAGGIPLDRGADRAGERVLVPGAGTHESQHGFGSGRNTWRVRTRVKRIRSFSSRWR